ncbi:MAG: hypothetical protein NTV34_15765, partial [Proteobacteria bacterium]|nr:hypothetical protein [Pseudomonadota bacterium]
QPLVAEQAILKILPHTGVPFFDSGLLFKIVAIITFIGSHLPMINLKSAVGECKAINAHIQVSPTVGSPFI